VVKIAYLLLVDSRKGDSKKLGFFMTIFGKFLRELCLIPDLTLHELRMAILVKSQIGTQGSSKKILFDSLLSDLMLPEEEGKRALGGLVRKKILRNTKFFRKETPMIFFFLSPDSWKKRLEEDQEKAIKVVLLKASDFDNPKFPFSPFPPPSKRVTKEQVAEKASLLPAFQAYAQGAISPFKAALRRLEVMEEQQKLKGTVLDPRVVEERAKAEEHALKKRAVIEALRKDEDLFDFLFEKLEEKKIQKKEEVDKRLEQKFNVILPTPASRSRRSSSTQAARA